MLSFLIISIALGVAEALAGDITLVLLVVSAVGMFMVIFLVPVVNHFVLLFGWCALAALEVLDVVSRKRNITSLQQLISTVEEASVLHFGPSPQNNLAARCPCHTGTNSAK